MTVEFHTLGCKLNQIETEALAAAFREYPEFCVRPLGEGLTSEPADLVIINSCTVTGKSEQKARRIIRKSVKGNPEAVVVVTGCYAEMEAPVIRALDDRVVASGQKGKVRLLDLPAFLAGSAERGDRLGERIHSFLEGEGDADPFRFEVSDLSFHSRPFLKIQEGCDNRCTYCRVCLARGGALSLCRDEVLRRVQLLEDSGHQEVVLTGVNVDSWNDGSGGLASLVRYLATRTRTIRFRISSLHPEMIDRELADSFSVSRVCPHFHISVQSGSPGVLKRMLRSYGPREIQQGIDLLRACFDDPFIAADIIAGFPGESESEWHETETLVRQLRFASLHVFPFSPRPGTAAEKMRPQIPQRIAGERAAALIKLSEQGYREYAGRWSGRTLNPIVEGHGSGALAGVAENYLRFPFESDTLQSDWGRVIPSRLVSVNGEFRFEPLGKNS